MTVIDPSPAEVKQIMQEIDTDNLDTSELRINPFDVSQDGPLPC